MYFRGRTLRALDAKSRLMLTPEFRRILGGGHPQGAFVLTMRDGGLVGYPMPLWQDVENALAGLKNPSRAVRDFLRLFVGGAQEMIPDRHGRVLLPQSHLAYAGIEGEAWLVGMIAKFELWSPARLTEAISTDFSDISRQLEESGLDVAL